MGNTKEEITMASMKRTGDGRYTIHTSKRDRLLHIETDKGIINIHLNLEDVCGNSVDSISLQPDASDVNGSPIDVLILDPSDNATKKSMNIRMVLDKHKSYQSKLVLTKENSHG